MGLYRYSRYRYRKYSADIVSETESFTISPAIEKYPHPLTSMI